MGRHAGCASLTWAANLRRTPRTGRSAIRAIHVSLRTTFAARRFHRTVTDDEFFLPAAESGETGFSFPLPPMTALQDRVRYVASYATEVTRLHNGSRQRIAPHLLPKGPP